METAMKDSEKLLLEAVRSMLRQDVKLGLAYHKPDQVKRESSHFMQFQRETIDDMYQLAISESKFADSITAAFSKVHCHKYIDDPTFKLAMDAEMRSMGLPKEDRELAIKSLDKVIKELVEGGERGAGWNPRMDDLVDLTSNADKREMTHEAPWTGGGPNPLPEREKALKAAK
jgi:hypothetical protein